MYCIRFLLFILLILTPFNSFAQDDFTTYVQPQIALNYPVVSNYSHNFAVQQRNYLYDDSQLDWRARQLDVVHFSKLKTSVNTSVAFGIQYRFRKNFEPDKNNELRLTQQFNKTFKPYLIRFGHRFRSEQRITNALTTYRFRYRFALDTPLNGEQLDIGEGYFTASLESLLSVARNNVPQYDQRFSAQVGWLLYENVKLQTGVEYRFEDYTHATQNILFFLTSLVFSL